MKQSAPDLAELRVLLIDSKPHSRNLVRSMLSRRGIQGIVAAQCGEEAIQTLQQSGDQRFDCIISDCYMEPVNGLQLLQKIRAGCVAGLEPDICFVLLTGFADAGLVNLAIALDANAYVLKPLSTEKLTNSLIRGLARKWRLQSPKYYTAIEGLETPPELIDTSQRYCGSARLIDPISVMGSAGDVIMGGSSDDFSFGTRTVRLTKSRPAPNPSHDPFQDIPNLHLSLVEDIQEGDILAQHVHDTHGKLLISGGTVLEERAVERLFEVAVESGEHVKLWIGRGCDPSDAYQLSDHERSGPSTEEDANAIPLAGIS